MAKNCSQKSPSDRDAILNVKNGHVTEKTALHQYPQTSAWNCSPKRDGHGIEWGAFGESRRNPLTIAPTYLHRPSMAHGLKSHPIFPIIKTAPPLHRAHPTKIWDRYPAEENIL